MSTAQRSLFSDDAPATTTTTAAVDEVLRLIHDHPLKTTPELGKLLGQSTDEIWPRIKTLINAGKVEQAEVDYCEVSECRAARWAAKGSKT